MHLPHIPPELLIIYRFAPVDSLAFDSMGLSAHSVHYTLQADGYVSITGPPNADYVAYADVDECVVANICSENAVCKNYVGPERKRPSCTCKPGYVGDGVECVQFNQAWSPVETLQKYYRIEFL